MPRGLKGLAVVLGTGLVIALSGCAEPRQAEQPAARTTEPARAESTATDHPGQHAAPAAAPADPRQSQPANAAQPGSAEAPAAASAGTQPEPAAVGKEAEDQAKKEAKEARDRVRKLSKLQRDLEVARLRLSKLKLDQDHAEIKFDESLAKAKADLELARKKLADFKQISVPERTERAKLNLAMAEDGLREAQEELAQLELMYSEEQFADKTKEIVVGRAAGWSARSATSSCSGTSSRRWSRPLFRPRRSSRTWPWRTGSTL
jgi:hypothetical protein